MKQKHILAFLIFISLNASAQDVNDTGYVRAHYTKTEVFIPMRDGIKLYTAIYTPKDQTKPHPIIMQRTPYSCWPYGADSYRRRLSPNSYLMKDDYIVVYQDARGRFKSEGKFREMTPAIDNKKSKQDVDESSDTYDTIDWLLKNTPNNGKVGMWGVSFPGFYSSAALPDAHPALKAVSPQAPMSDEFIGDDCNHNGAFFLLDNFSFYAGFDGERKNNGEAYIPFFETETQDAYNYFLKLGSLKNMNKAPYFTDTNSTWRQVVAHDTYDDFWKGKSIRPHLKNIKPAVLIVGGWFDAEDMFGALKTYAAIEKQTPGNDCRLVMGPWTHGAWGAPLWRSFGAYQFGQDLNKYYQEQIETKFFEHYLEDKGDFNAAEITLFETGSNQWKSYPSWPPAESSSEAFYLQPGNKLDTKKPSDSKSMTEYISDPAKPVPYTAAVQGWRNDQYLVEDQRFVSSRPDVISFVTDTLRKDLNLTGPIAADLFVSTTGTDADFIVKLIDVWPDNTVIKDATGKPVAMGGYQQMVRAEVFRGKFRRSYSNPVPFKPDVIDSVKISLNEVAHTFKQGHAIMVQVQSSWFPLVDRNPQQFGKIAEMNDGDFRKATIRIWHDAQHPSHLMLPVMK